MELQIKVGVYRKAYWCEKGSFMKPQKHVEQNLVRPSTIVRLSRSSGKIVKSTKCKRGRKALEVSQMMACDVLE